MHTTSLDSAFWLRLVGGAALGALATKPMTALMERADAAPVNSRRSSLPPRIITSEVLRGAGIRWLLTQQQRRQATTASHYGFGAAMGMAYGVLLGSGTSSFLVRGAGFGLGVWAVSYLGWLPAMGSRAGADRQSTKNNVVMLVAHLVWGMSLGAMDAWLRGTLRRGNPSLPHAAAQSDEMRVALPRGHLA